jgi:hypothetical protein
LPPRSRGADMNQASSRTPIHPYWVLLSAILLPGSGHILTREPVRGLTMQLFMVTLGWITWHITTSQQSLAGRLAGGLFIYAVSIMDAYRIARLRWATYHQTSSRTGQERSNPDGVRPRAKCATSR